MFTPRTYLKSELAMLYAPDSCIDTAVKNLYRWIQHCQPLCRDLEKMNYNPRRKHFMKREVEAIVHHLGEPWRGSPLLLPNHKSIYNHNIHSSSTPMRIRPIPPTPARKKHSVHSVHSVFFLSTPYSNLFQQKNYYYIYNIIIYIIVNILYTLLKHPNTQEIYWVYWVYWVFLNWTWEIGLASDVCEMMFVR